ncbi:MAG: hypothetical protein J7M34_10215 [Anaerolineae bacterium]|nr:hypothetical protein [Anaerolineae bacterium]
MLRRSFQSGCQTRSANTVAISIALLTSNLLFNILANVSFKLSASTDTWRSFIAWQILGNLAGLITVLTLTGLLRFIPLHVAYPVTTGLAIIGVEIVAANMVFGERITSTQWLGVLLVVAGVALIGGR